DRVLRRRNARLTSALMPGGDATTCEIAVLPARSAENAFQLSDSVKGKALGKEGVV
ncbi:hypothetical protein MNEG_10713, partial [Monoraphidium neglectum]